MKEVLIKVVNLIRKVILFLPSLVCVLIYYIRIVQYKNMSICMSLIPTKIGDVMRWWFYKLTLKKVGTDFRIFWLSYIVYPSVEIGNNVTIEEKCVVSKCKIGDDVILAANVSIMSGKDHHDVDDLDNTFYDSKESIKTVILENNLWIGTHAVIMDDILEGTVVGAGAVVTKTYPVNSIIGGVPAKFIRKRGRDGNK